MLVLTRKTDQKIRIAEDITITVLKVKGRSVQLGIEAPDGIQILRGELADELDSEFGRRQTPTDAEGPAGSTEISPLLHREATEASRDGREAEPEAACERWPLPHCNAPRVGDGRRRVTSASGFSRPTVRIRAIVVRV